MCCSRKPKGVARADAGARQFPLTIPAAGGVLCRGKMWRHNRCVIESDTENDAITVKCPRRTTALNKDKATQPFLSSLGSLGREGYY